MKKGGINEQKTYWLVMVYSANYENMAINYSNTNCDRLHSGLEGVRLND